MRANKVAYWIGLIYTCAFWLFGMYVAGTGLSMSATGRLRGGLLVNATFTVFILAWMIGATALVVSVWKGRSLTRPINLAQLARSPRPSDPAEAAVWWWSKATRRTWWVVLAFLLFILIAGWLGLLRAGTP